MSDQNLPDNEKAVPSDTSAAPANEPAPKKAEISMGRIAIWVCVTGVALYLIISGVVGIVAKGS
jgi:hypothetical protein